MSPDFYIRKYLKIEHQNGVSYYELPNQRGYFSYDIGPDYDSDDNEDLPRKELLDKLYIDMMHYYLTPKKDVIIYQNNEFVNEQIKLKYLPIIQNKINGTYVNKYNDYKDNGSFSNISEVTQITKCETRYEPFCV
jgi:hypothetical protein